MPTTLRNTDILFNDGSTQSTAATTPTTLYAVGTYITGRPNNTTTYAANSTLAGSSLYSITTTTYWSSSNGWTESINGSNYTPPSPGVGTWRCMSIARSDSAFGMCGLWVRIS